MDSNVSARIRKKEYNSSTDNIIKNEDKDEKVKNKLDYSL